MRENASKGLYWHPDFYETIINTFCPPGDSKYVISAFFKHWLFKLSNSVTTFLEIFLKRKAAYCELSIKRSLNTVFHHIFITDLTHTAITHNTVLCQKAVAAPPTSCREVTKHHTHLCVMSLLVFIGSTFCLQSKTVNSHPNSCIFIICTHTHTQ